MNMTDYLDKLKKFDDLNRQPGVSANAIDEERKDIVKKRNEEINKLNEKQTLSNEEQAYLIILLDDERKRLQIGGEDKQVLEKIISQEKNLLSKVDREQLQSNIVKRIEEADKSFESKFQKVTREFLETENAFHHDVKKILPEARKLLKYLTPEEQKVFYQMTLPLASIETRGNPFNDVKATNDIEKTTKDIHQVFTSENFQQQQHDLMSGQWQHSTFLDFDKKLADKKVSKKDKDFNEAKEAFVKLVNLPGARARVYDGLVGQLDKSIKEAYKENGQMPQPLQENVKAMQEQAIRSYQETNYKMALVGDAIHKSGVRGVGSYVYSVIAEEMTPSNMTPQVEKIFNAINSNKNEPVDVTQGIDSDKVKQWRDEVVATLNSGNQNKQKSATKKSATMKKRLSRMLTESHQGIFTGTLKTAKKSKAKLEDIFTNQEGKKPGMK